MKNRANERRRFENFIESFLFSSFFSTWLIYLEHSILRVNHSLGKRTTEDTRYLRVLFYSVMNTLARTRIRHNAHTRKGTHSADYHFLRSEHDISIKWDIFDSITPRCTSCARIHFRQHSHSHVLAREKARCGRRAGVLWWWQPGETVSEEMSVVCGTTKEL